MIASLVPERRVAWDCATGNGQVAVDLARHFQRVIATDASSDQIANAFPAANVEYRVAAAEDSGLESGTVDAVTVGQALHWLDIPAFAREVRRVTVRGGLVAAWSYGSCSPGAEMEPLLREFEHVTLGPYWNAGRRWVDEGYRTIDFPFDEVQVPPFRMRATWTLSQFTAYLASWSAATKYRDATGIDPVAPLEEKLAVHWGPTGAMREIVWPLGIRIGRT